MNIARPPKLLDQMREALRSRHYSRRTEQTYCQWVKRYIFFHKVRHPAEMAEPEINAFLTHLARHCLRPTRHAQAWIRRGASVEPTKEYTFVIAA